MACAIQRASLETLIAAARRTLVVRPRFSQTLVRVLVGGLVGEGRPCTTWLISWCNRSMNSAWWDGRQLWRLLARMLEQQCHSFVFGRSVLRTMPQRILGLQQQQGHRWMRVEYSQRLVELWIVWIAMQHQPRDTIVHRRSVPRNVPDRLGKL